MLSYCDSVRLGPETVCAGGLELGSQQISFSKVADLRSISALVALNQQAQRHDTESEYPLYGKWKVEKGLLMLLHPVSLEALPWWQLRTYHGEHAAEIPAHLGGHPY
jgi:hypothetical protein